MRFNSEFFNALVYSCDIEDSDFIAALYRCFTAFQKHRALQFAADGLGKILVQLKTSRYGQTPTALETELWQFLSSLKSYCPEGLTEETVTTVRESKSGSSFHCSTQLETFLTFTPVNRDRNDPNKFVLAKTVFNELFGEYVDSAFMCFMTAKKYGLSHYFITENGNRLNTHELLAPDALKLNRYYRVEVRFSVDPTVARTPELERKAKYGYNALLALAKKVVEDCPANANPLLSFYENEGAFGLSIVLD